MPEEIKQENSVEVPTENQKGTVIEEIPNFWLNESNIEKFQLGYKIFLGLIVLMVVINVFLPVWLRRDNTYVVSKSGCFGIDIENTCIGITKYAREVRKDAIFE